MFSDLEAAIRQMDDKILDREGLDKLQLLLPSKEEVVMIKEHQSLQPSLPLGEAEQLLLLLHSVPHIEAKLKLWAFKSDFKSMEREMWEPLKDLKAGIEAVQTSPTLVMVFSVLLTLGNTLNRKEVRGFQLDYLARLVSVKDTATQRSLTGHVASLVRTNLPQATDLASELAPLTKVARTDYRELGADLATMARECQAALTYLTTGQHQDTGVVKSFLQEAARRIGGLQSAEKKVAKRWSRLLEWLGLAEHLHQEYPPHVLAKLLTDFSLHYKQEWDRLARREEAGGEGKREVVGGGKIGPRGEKERRRVSAPVVCDREESGELEQCLASMARRGARGEARRERHSMVEIQSREET